MNVTTTIVLPVLIGVIAGLRAMTAPAAISLAARAGWLDLATTRLAFLGYPVTPWILTALALGELVTDQLPGTPSRTVPIQFGTRILMGGLTGGAIGATGGALAIGVLAGAVGAVIGTLGGRACRARLAAALGSDRPAAVIEDLVAIGGALLIVEGTVVTTFDAIIIGAGQAGPPLAGRLTAAGLTVAFVERHLFGGTCVNTGCMPTKTLVASAYAAHLARRASDYGVVVAGPPRIDMRKVKARADAVSASSRTGIEQSLRTMNGCTVFTGHARFESASVVRVGGQQLTAPRIFVNVGGRALVPEMPGIGEVPVLTNTSILALDQVPKHLIVIGGSYVGLEFAQMHRRFGAEVTIVEKGERLVGREDEDVSLEVRSILEREGITVRTSAACIGLAKHDPGVAVSVDCSHGPPTYVGSAVLVAVGRRPNTDDLGLAEAGVATDARGYITVNDDLSTSVPGIWALGDCNGRGAFTHTAYNDFEIVAANLLDGEHRAVSDRVPVYALYIDPPLGRVGMTEAQARATGRPLLLGKRPMSRVGRAIEKGETQGFMKVVADATTKKILGAAILGTGGDEAIHGLLDIVNARVTYDRLQRAVPIHPTVSELIPTLLSEMKPAD